MTAPFVIFSLPRSRSAWLSRFLTYGDWKCGHDELRHMRSLDDVRAWFSQPFIGTAETAAAPWWRLLDRFAPNARVLIVRRPVAEVVDSLMRLKAGFERASITLAMERLDRKLDQIAVRVPALSVTFADLAREEACARVFEHCTGLPFDRLHWARWAAENVQIDMVAMLRHFAAYRPALDKLAAVARQQTLVAMQGREIVEPDGITLQQEDFDTWVRDGDALFREHCVQVGERPDEWHTKNIPLMRRLYDLGVMQIMTARSNGRMLGYLMTVVSPSLESETRKSATNTTFFVSPDAPGLGLKLQRAALAGLKERGVDEVFMHAGVRGSGDRIDAIYRRLGAQDGGRIFRLQLAEA